MSRTLYPIHVEPISTSPETVTESRWHQPFSEPVRRKKGLAVALIVASVAPVFVPVPEVVTPDKWLYQWTDPVRSKPGLATRLQPTTVLPVAPVTGSGDVLFSQTGTLVPYQVTFLYQSIADPVPVTTAPETVTLDKWFRPLTDPVRRGGMLASKQQALSLGPFPVTASIDRWGAPLSEPVRLRRPVDVAAPFVPVVTAAEDITPDKWLNPLSEPRRQKPSVAQQQDLAFVKAAPFPESVTIDRWLESLSEPVRRRVGTPGTASAFVPVVAAADVTIAGSEVSVFFPKVTLYQSLSDVITVPPAETITVDKWYRPLSDPTRRTGFQTQEQQVLAFVKAAPFPESTTVDRWFEPLSEPRRRYRTPEGGAIPAPFVSAAEIVTADKWFSSLSEPQRRKSYVSQQRDLAFVKAAPFSEVVTLDKWYRDLGVPVGKWLRSYSAALSPYSFQSNYLVPAPYVDPPMASWSYSWSMPVRVRTSVMTASQQASVIPEIPQPNPPPAPGVYTVSGLYVIDQFTDNTVVYDYAGGVSHRTN